MWHPGMAVLLSATRLRENHMTDVVSITREGAIGLVALNNPPVNAAGAALRAGLVAALNTLEADSTVKVIAIYGEGRTFPAGADIREFGKPPVDPWLPEVCNRIEACARPVVAALHGTALGGGLEVALAAHWRIAQPAARVGFPEVTLGLLPGAGGTQRAPRLAGAEAALDLMLSGRPIDAGQALAAGLIDEVAEGDLIDAALARAQVLADAPPPRTSDRDEGMRDPVAYEAAVRARREAAADPNIPAPAKIVDC